MIPHETIEIFSFLWWQTNIITIMLIISVISIGKYSRPKIKEMIAKAIGIILILRLVSSHIYMIHIGIWSVQSSLPLHLCGLSAILSGFVIFWRNQLAYEFLYYWGISGTLHSLLTPEFTVGSDSFLFIEYYISHGGILLSAVYLSLILDMKPRLGSWWKIFLLSQLFLPVIGFINWILNANYMYLCIKPIANNPLLFGQWPWYILGIEIFALLHFLLIYLPFFYQYNKIKLK